MEEINIEGKLYDFGEVTGVDIGYDKDQTYISSGSIKSGVLEISFSCPITHKCKFCGCLMSFQNKDKIKCGNGCEGLISPISAYNKDTN